jgi:hypothetical protein
MVGNISYVKDIENIDKLTPRLHNSFWVVSDSRKWWGRHIRSTLIQDGAIFTEEDSLNLAKDLNKQVAEAIFGSVVSGMAMEIKGPFYAYRLATARDLGLL